MRYGTGGGLCRPIFAEFLKEAKLPALAKKYADLGRGWSALAEAALPDEVTEFRAAKELYRGYGELFRSGGPVEEKRAVWQELDELAVQAKKKFPLSDAACAELRAGMQERARALIDSEKGLASVEP